MNKNYRVIWNHSQGNYVVTSELARGKVKSSRSSTARRLTAGCVAKAFMALASVWIIQPALAAPAYGEYASGAGNIINIQDKDVATSDDSAHALFVEKGATAHSNNVNFTTDGKKAYGVYVNGAGSNIDITGGSVNTAGAFSHGVIAGNGGRIKAADVVINSAGFGLYADKATINGKNLTVNSQEYGANAIGSGAVIDVSDSRFTVAGANSYAVLAENGGKTTSINSHYVTTGKNSSGGWVNGKSVLTIFGGSITNTGGGSTGILAKNGGVLNVDGTTVESTAQGINGYGVNTVANIANSHVTVSANGAFGLLAENGGKTTSHNSHYVATGDNAFGAWVNTGSELNVFGGSISTTGKNSTGMLAKNGGVLNAENIQIDARGDGALAKGEGSRVNITDSIISSGAYYGGAVTAYDKGFATVRNSKLIAVDNNSAGIYADYSGQVDAENVDIEITGAGYGVGSSFNGRTNITNSKIISQSGGTAFNVESGSVLTADNVFAEMDNNKNPGELTNAITATSGEPDLKSLTINISNSLLHIKGNNAAGIVARKTEGHINLNNTVLTVDNGPAIIAYNHALTTVNLDNSLLSGTTLLETGLDPYGEDAGADVRGITVDASNHSQLQGDVNIDRSKTQASSVSLDSGSRWQGAAHDLQDLSLAGSSQWNMTGSSTVDNLTAKDSTITFDHGAGDFHTLTVKGDYHADNAKLVMNLALAGDDTASDKLHIAGNASGTTKVQVHNAGGKGAATLEGIELIRVEGTQNGEFLQDGRIVGGAWDYALVQDKNGKWRLVSDPIPVDPTPVDPIKDEGGDTGTVIAPEVPQPKRTPRARPEVGSYIANLAAASNLFTLSAADRPGVTEYRDALTGKVEKTTLWLRNEGAHGRFSDSTAQLKSTTNSYMTQLGGDIAQWSLNGRDRFSLGVMAGYGNAKSNTLSKTTGYSAKGQVNGYSGGIYAGWQQNSQTRSGAFVDSWLAYNTFSNSVKGEGLGQESYKSKGMTASLEGGYSFAFGEQQQYRLQPKAQAVWMGVKTGDYTEQNGTRVSATGNHNVQTRTGVRATMYTATAQPYAEVNWLHNTQRFGSKLDGVKIEQAGARNIGEVKLGLEVNPSQHVGIWGGIAQQVGGKGFSDSSASLGVKVSF
ncbi:autotransporter outer membrane beta-barrel domain-containing protein [Pantoea sp. PNT02]|nr:autotransporter outer membrane beta-barrel domain-containing protein [Pantoea sp. PNT02]